MNAPLPMELPDAACLARVAHALDRRRLGVAATVALLLSIGPLLGSGTLQFLSPAEVALAWLEHLAELLAVGAMLVLAYTLLDETLPRRMPWRLAAVCSALGALSAAATLLLHAYYASDFGHLPPIGRWVADTLRWGLPAVALVLIADMHQRALEMDAAARATEIRHGELGRDEAGQRLALLQAQIEPHFLFNVLGNVRRLYRTQPQAGAEAIGSLMRYLHAALPLLRSHGGTLREELELVRAYLELCALRMGGRMRFSIDVDPKLHEAEFPPMLLATLVENAIKHGLEPAGGGEVRLRARRRRGMLEVSVRDDGTGFGSAAGSGTGVGLANVHRQLAAHYPGRASLALRGREPHGAVATITLPWRPAAIAAPFTG